MPQADMTLPETVVTPDDQPAAKDDAPDVVALAMGGADFSGMPKTIAPMHQLSADRIADHSGIPSAAAALAHPDAPPDLPPAGPISQAMRYQYSKALQGGQVDGPQDFAERAVGMAHSLAPDADPAQMVNGAQAMAAALPSHEDLIDHSAAIANDLGDPTLAPTIKSNLLDAWTQTGASVDNIVQAANQDPDIKAQLATSPPVPAAQSPHFPTLADLSEPGRDAIRPVSYFVGGLDVDPLGVVNSIARLPGQEADTTEKIAKMQAEGASNYDIFSAEMERPTIKLVAGLLGFKAGGAMAGAIADGSALKTIKAIATDESGQLKSPNEVKQDIHGAGLAEFFPTVGDERATAMRALIRKNVGIGRQAKDIASDLLEAERKSVYPLLPEDRAFHDAMAQHAEVMTAAKERFVAEGGDPERFTSERPAGDPAPPLSQLQVLRDHMENRPDGGRLAEDHPLFPLAEKLRLKNKELWSIIETEFPEAISNYVDGYYRHAWADQAAFDGAFGSGRMGTGASLQHRTVPYYFDGLVRGLKPKFPDPIDNALHDIQGKLDFIASQRIIKTAEENGHLYWSDRPRQDGDVRLQGRDGTKQQLWTEPAPANSNSGEPIARARDLYAYAHPSVATIYNNWVGKGFNEWGPVAAATYQKLQFAANASTALKLGLSGAHSFNIAHEVVASGLANAFGEISHGEIVRGLKDMGMSLTVLPRIGADLVAGRNFQQAYLGKVADLSPVQQQIRQLYVEAGGRPMGRGEEYFVGQTRNLFTAWRQGGLPEMLRNDLASVTPARATGMAAVREGAATPLRMAAWGADVLGRVANTISAPLFDWAIPKLKVAAWASEMEAHIRANPLATGEELLSVARRNMDSMDDRFGELNQENLFLPRAVKQTMNTALLSTGWWYGTMRAFGRGMADLATAKNTTRSRWLLALPITTGYLAMAYQMFKTGNGPSSWMDFILPKTGGSLESGNDERAKFLSPWKEFMDAWSVYFNASHANDPFKGFINGAEYYVAGKASPLFRAIGDFMLAPSTTAWHDQLARDVMPILAENPAKLDSTIGGFERWLGLSQGPRSMTDPEALGKILDTQATTQQRIEQSRAYRADRLLENPTGVEKPESTRAPSGRAGRSITDPDPYAKPRSRSRKRE